MEEIERTYGKTTNTDTNTLKVTSADTNTASRSQPSSVEKTSAANAFSLLTTSVPTAFSSSAAETTVPTAFAPPLATTAAPNAFSLATTAVSNIFAPATGSAEPKSSILSSIPLFGNKAESKTAGTRVSLFSQAIHREFIFCLSFNCAKILSVGVRLSGKILLSVTNIFASYNRQKDTQR